MRFSLAVLFLSGCFDYNSLSSAFAVTGDGGFSRDDAGRVIDAGDTSDGGGPLPDLDPPADACGTVHITGFTDYTVTPPVPESWVDCVPRGTHDLAQATAACEAHRAKNGIAAACVATACPLGAVVALSQGATANCGVWQYAGVGVGTVSTPDVNCRCPAGGEPSWN